MAGIDYLRNFLQNENFRFEEKEGHISFKYQGTQFVAFKNSDSPYLQICIIFYDVTPQNRIQCLEACNKVNSNKFIIKYTIDDDSVWVNYELLPNNETDFEQIFNNMDSSRRNFNDAMEG